MEDEYHLIHDCDKFQELRGNFPLLGLLPADLLSTHLVDFDEWQVCKFVSFCMKIVDEEVAPLSPSEAEQPAGRMPPL